MSMIICTCAFKPPKAKIQCRFVSRREGHPVHDGVGGSYRESRGRMHYTLLDTTGAEDHSRKANSGNLTRYASSVHRWSRTLVHLWGPADKLASHLRQCGDAGAVAGYPDSEGALQLIFCAEMPRFGTRQDGWPQTWRRGWDLNPRMEVLQTSPLGLLGTAPGSNSITKPSSNCQSPARQMNLQRCTATNAFLFATGKFFGQEGAYHRDGVRTI